jgi:sec-independent protein translocase protein TatA
MIGTTEIIVIAGVALVLFGSTALPKFARSLGQAKKEFDKGIKQGVEEGKEEEKKSRKEA